MTNSYITNLNIVQAVLCTLSFFCFIGIFSIDNQPAKKAGYLLMCVLAGCIGFCSYGLMLNCYAQTIDSAKHRQSDLQILLYGLYFLSTLCCEGYVYYWMIIIARPSPIERLAAMQNKAFVLLALMINFGVMMAYYYTAVQTLIYVSGFPNGYGDTNDKAINKFEVVIVKKY